MHCLCVFAFLALCNYSYAENNIRVKSDITDDKLRKLMEVFGEMLNGPQVLPRQNIFIDEPLVFLNGSMLNGVANLNGFKVSFAHVNMSTLEFSSGIKYNSIDLVGNYSLYVDNEWVHAESADEFSVNTNDISMNVYLKLYLTNNATLQVEDIMVDYNATAKVNITNLGGYQEVSDTLNDLINYLMPGTLDSSKPLVQEEIRKNGIELGNNFIFKDMTLDNLSDYIDSLIS